MPESPFPGGQPLNLQAAPLPRIEHLHRVTQFRRLLNFSGWSINDVVNNPVAKNDLLRWHKIGRWTERRMEVNELEKQWNPLR